jgi:ABC-type nitrate/sulfonate/bicarbonate transport system permease component
MADLEYVGRKTRSSEQLVDEAPPEFTTLANSAAPRSEHPLWGSIVALGLFLAFLLAWEYASANRLIPSLFYPRPTQIAKTLISWFTSTKWQPILLPTLQRLGVGLTIGGVIGYVLGLVLGYNRRLYQVIDPILSFIYPIPKISLLPLALVVFGLGDGPRQFIIALGAFFPMVINTISGVRAINPNYFAIAQVYGARHLMIFRRILLPGSLPFMLTGFRIAFNSAFVVTVAVELNTARDGLGYIVWEAWQTMRTEYLYGGIVIIALIGVTSTALLRIFERLLVKWQA